MKVYALTLGCKVNQYESDALLTLFAKHDYEITEDIQEADVIIVNSCTVTSVSAGKSRQAVRRAKKSNPNAVVVLTGCYSEIDYEKAGQILEADIVTGANHKEKILELVEQALRNKERILVQNSQKNLTIDDLPPPFSGDASSFRISIGRKMLTSIFIFVSRSSVTFCAYCSMAFVIIP
jgi:threonylcarbamoyladenosine tRNA methylthiotransferase MtaB